LKLSSLGSRPESSSQIAGQEIVFSFLADPATHGIVGPVKRIDTHAATIFLAGPDAYKVKKAVRFSFMDQSTLERRHQACLAEIAVNRHFTPVLYRGVLPITRQNDSLALGGKGVPVEWAVHMRRFDETRTLDFVAERGELSPHILIEVGRLIADSHRHAPVKDGLAAMDSLAGVIEETLGELVDAPSLFPARRHGLSPHGCGSISSPRNRFSGNARRAGMAVPLRTDVLRKTQFVRSVIGASARTIPGCFSTGKDSPVMLASVTRKSAASMTTPSAGMRLPAERRMRSPGTTAAPSLLKQYDGAECSKPHPTYRPRQSLNSLVSPEMRAELEAYMWRKRYIANERGSFAGLPSQTEHALLGRREIGGRPAPPGFRW
jgi:hypothetical protein